MSCNSYKRCCVPDCSEGSANVLHEFPNPTKDLDRFMNWINSIGGDILKLTNEYIYKNRRVCRMHFEAKYHCRNNRLSKIAVPTINMPCLNSNIQWTNGADGRPNDSDPSTSQSCQMEDRKDNPISPQGDDKHRQIDIPMHTVGSNAWSTNSPLNVAIRLVPRVKMTQEEAASIQDQIQSEIFAACLKSATSSSASYAPAFEGRPYLNQGALELWCHDEQALLWLQRVVPRLKSPREGKKLAFVKPTKMPLRVKSTLFVPNFKEDVGKLHQIIALQNPWYEVSKWTLYTFKRIYKRTTGIFLVLGIPKEQIDTILARGRKVAYSTGSIYIRFLNKEGLSDIPSKETPKPKMPKNMDTDEPSDTID